MDDRKELKSALAFLDALEKISNEHGVVISGCHDGPELMIVAKPIKYTFSTMGDLLSWEFETK